MAGVVIAWDLGSAFPREEVFPMSPRDLHYAERRRPAASSRPSQATPGDGRRPRLRSRASRPRRLIGRCRASNGGSPSRSAPGDRQPAGAHGVMERRGNRRERR